MIGLMTPLFQKALLKADEVRMQLHLNMFQPINIFDACIDLGLTVRFIDVNMEGMYTKQKDGSNPTIILSNLRPLPRRIYTCGHELGHHIFGHGLKLDMLTDRSKENVYDDDELLVDSFAGALLIPIVGIQAAFSKRKLRPEKATATDYYAICSFFGIGYRTLITHCRANKLISETKAQSLLKTTPIKLFKSLFSSFLEPSYFKIIDQFSKVSTIDLEVSNYIILPTDVEVEGDHLRKIQTTIIGTAYQAIKSGIVRIANKDNSISSFVRVQNFQYMGLAENRHLENTNE